MLKSKLLALAAISCVSVLMGQLAYKDPLDLESWERFRLSKPHPRCMLTGAEVENARRLVREESWSQNFASGKINGARQLLKELTPERLEQFIGITTPMGVFYPCPACRAKGLPWHPNGNWSWNYADPEHITCVACHTVFPHPDYPEDVVIQSKWDPRQKITFVGGEPFPVYGVITRTSFSGMIRTRKLQYTLHWLDTLADAYLFSGDYRFAEGIRMLMLRYAEVLPHYLFGVAIYSEFADCDPHIAAKDPLNLPEDEITAPPNRPNRRIHSGYWQGNRMGSAGMDGSIAVRLANAYDLSCTARREDGTPVYTDEECRRIEKDVLLELAYHFVYDERINNKSVGNRAGAAAIGLAIGQPDLVRFGLDGFLKTVNSWFLPDGSTSESSGYGMMTMNCIYSFAYLFRDYSDPEGYEPPEGAPLLNHFNACRDTDYGTCWQNAILTLLGDFTYPSIADSHRNGRLSTAFSDMLAICLPNDFNLSYFKKISNGKLTSRRTALVYGNPPDMDGVPEFSLPDIVFPYLGQGYFRTGEGGFGSAAILNASNWGGHHHLDSLDLVLWQRSELLSDLGYLWDHQEKPRTYRTYAHNLVMLDGENQITQGRGGSFELFETAGCVKAMRASSHAYKQAELYQRTLLQIEHDNGFFYWLDLFRAKGGKVRDFVFHGPNNDYTLNQVEFKEPVKDDENLADKQRFVVLIPVEKLGTIEVSDPEVVEIDSRNRPIGENMATPYLEDIPESRLGKNWGIYRGNGTCAWKPGEGKNSRSIIYSALTHDKSGIVNHALVIGGGDGYTAPNGFIGKRNAAYRVRFWARGDNIIRVKAVCYDMGKENDPGARRHCGAVLDKPEVTSEWKLYEAKITFGNPNHSYKYAQRFHGKTSGSTWGGTWRLSGGPNFTAMLPADERETLIFSDDWGQRDWKNSDLGATLPYFMRRRTGDQLDEYVSLFYTHDQPLIHDLKVREVENGLAVEVDTAQGRDLILFGRGGMMTHGGMTTDAEIAVSVASKSMCMFYGTTLEEGQLSLKCRQPLFKGQEITAVSEKYDAYFEIKGDLPDRCAGQTLLVTDDQGVAHAYPILKSVKAGDALRLYVKVNGYGFPARPGVSWQLPSVVSLER